MIPEIDTGSEKWAKVLQVHRADRRRASQAEKHMCKGTKSMKHHGIGDKAQANWTCTRTVRVKYLPNFEEKLRKS